MNVPDDIILCIFRFCIRTFYTKILRIHFFDRSKFDVISNNTVICGKTDCFSYMLFAETLKDHIHHKGIHFWSIKYIKKLEITDSTKSCYRSIGIKSIKDHEAALNPAAHFYSKDNDKNTYWYKGYPDYWNFNETITVELNYNDWTVAFYNGCKKKIQYDITEDITYYFVAQLCANKKFSCFKIVPTPFNILKNINITY